MSELASIASRAANRGLPFLLTGGHAVIAHGFSRSTFDLDLIVRRADRQTWIELAELMGYSVHRQGDVFLQFNAPKADSFPLDLMFVNEDTFEKLRAESVPAPSSQEDIRVVSLKHLLALKCHAVKHGHSGRIVKDAD